MRVRVTPQSFFFAMVACGLPLAVTVGWTLGERPPQTPPATVTPGGTGGLGAAPERDKPVNPVDYPQRTSGARTATTTTPAAVRPRATDLSSPPASPGASHPPLIEPSVSGSAVVPSESAPPASPSVSPSERSSDPDAGRGARTF